MFEARERGWWCSSPLSRASADGDRIYAVIRGGAINQDGRTNGLTAPSRLAQEAVLRSAYAHAGITPAQVDYIEAHGTGPRWAIPSSSGAGGRCSHRSVPRNENVRWVRSRPTSGTSKPPPESPA